MNSRELIKLLKQHGWELVRIRGSHHQLKHPDHGHTVTVPHPKKDLGAGIVKAIKRQAGIED
jgi:predicted RNA binding protein YcfA (HicA-like mRNA interferase family)